MIRRHLEIRRCDIQYDEELEWRFRRPRNQDVIVVKNSLTADEISTPRQFSRHFLFSDQRIVELGELVVVHMELMSHRRYEAFDEPWRQVGRG